MKRGAPVLVLLTAAHASAKTIAPIPIHKRLTHKHSVVVVAVVTQTMCRCFPFVFVLLHRAEHTKGILEFYQLHKMDMNKKNEEESNETKIELCVVNSISIER